MNYDFDKIISEKQNGISVDNTLVYFRKPIFSRLELELASCLFFSYSRREKGSVVICDMTNTSKESLFYFMRTCFPTITNSDKWKHARELLYKEFGNVYNYLRTEFDKESRIALSNYNKFYKHQKEGLYYGCFRRHNLLAFEQGLGKSITSSTISIALNSNRTLIVGPAVTKWNWYEELTRTWNFGDENVSVIDSKKAIRSQNEKFIIINYDIIHKYTELLCELKIDHIILDECHKIKNPEAKRTKAVRYILNKLNPKITMLSGTPAPNRSEDVFVYLSLINHPLGKSYTSFMNRFVKQEYTPNGNKKSVGSKNIEYLSMALSNFMVRKTKEKCLDLPDKNYIRLYFELDDYKEEYDLAVEELKSKMKKSKKSFDEEKLAMATLNIITSKAKQKDIYLFAKDLINENVEFTDNDGVLQNKKKKIVIFSSYTEPLLFLEEKFKDCCVKIDGSVPTHKRQELINKFKDDDNCKVFLGNTTAAGIGINLVRENINDILFVNYPYTQAEIDQAIDRTHRIGKKSSINVYFTVCKESIDERLIEIIDNKYKDVSKLIDRKEATFDFESLLINEVKK